MTGFWQTLSRSARAGLLAGFLAIVLLAGLMGWWLLRPSYQVLFGDLKPQDAAAMTAELDRLKIPYRLGEGGDAILVDQASVHQTRLKLMGKDMPLHGAVGFELFNNTDFGMTEFAQKINYQRALQGELTRTILALAEVRDVRVHLAFPEQGLFRQAAVRAKAAVTLTLRQGQALRPEQISGVQRLVAAATPGMVPADVTVVDNRGVALSRLPGEGAEDGATAGHARLDLKKETENHLSRKAGLVLERSLGPGQALASVDVTLDMDQVRTSTESVLAAPAGRNDRAAGVVVRERESVRDSGAAPLDARAAAGAGAGGSSVQREVDYQVGRRVQQVVGQPGAIQRIQVLAVVRRRLDGVQLEQVRRMVAAAVGAVPERGDTVVVQPFVAERAEVDESAFRGKPEEETDAPAAPRARTAAGASTGPAQEGPAQQYIRIVAAMALLAALAAVAAVLLRRHRTAGPAASRALSEEERLMALARIQAWMQGEARPGSGR